MSFTCNVSIYTKKEIADNKKKKKSNYKSVITVQNIIKEKENGK